jgi:hypothetical protein
MASPRNAYQLLHAVETYRESEKEMPEGVEALLGDLCSKLQPSKADGSSSDDSDAKSEDSMGGAKEKSREKFREFSKKDEQ